MAREILSSFAGRRIRTSTTTTVERSQHIKRPSHARPPLITRLAAVTLAARLMLTLLTLWGTWELMTLSEPLGMIRWALLVPAVLAVRLIVFAELLDLEAAEAERAVLSAVFAVDPLGGRSKTVQLYAREYVRIYGRKPEGVHVLHDVYSREPFTVAYGRNG
jgi:hypothetical protein